METAEFVEVVKGVENPYSAHMDKVGRTTDKEVSQMEAYEKCREAILAAIKEVVKGVENPFDTADHFPDLSPVYLEGLRRGFKHAREVILAALKAGGGTSELRDANG